MAAADSLLDDIERLRNLAIGIGYKTQEEIKRDFEDSVETIKTHGKTGDILLVTSDNLIGFTIRMGSKAFVSHAAMLDVDPDGTKWVIDINPRPGNDLQRTPFEEWIKNNDYNVIIAGRPTYDLGVGQKAVDYLKTFYRYDKSSNVFQEGIPYNWLGLLGFFNNNSNTKICSELVHDAFKSANDNKPMPGLELHDTWRVSPGDLLDTMPSWGENLQDIVKEENQ